MDKDNQRESGDTRRANPGQTGDEIDATEVDINADLRAGRETALAIASASYGLIKVTGEDRVSWLNGLVTCDVSKVALGGASYGLAVGQKGKIVTDICIAVHPDEVHVLVDASRLETIRAHFDRYLIMEDAEMTLEASVPVYFVHGPRATDIVQRVNTVARASEPIHSVLLDRTGLGGAIVYTATPSRGEVLRRALEDAGVRFGSDAGWTTLRIERFVPEFGKDFDETTYPQEALLERNAVSFSKGCYLGQEVVCMLEMRGHVKKKLAGFTVEGNDIPKAGTEIRDENGASLGTVTSAVYSPTLGKPLFLAMVKRAYAEPGKLVNIDNHRAVAVSLPIE